MLVLNSSYFYSVNLKKMHKSKEMVMQINQIKSKLYVLRLSQTELSYTAAQKTRVLKILIKGYKCFFVLNYNMLY